MGLTDTLVIREIHTIRSRVTLMLTSQTANEPLQWYLLVFSIFNSAMRGTALSSHYTSNLLLIELGAAKLPQKVPIQLKC